MQNFNINPMAFLNMMANSNPQAKKIVQALQSGKDPEKLFYDMCKQQGVDPNTVLQSLNNNNPNSR